MIKVIVELWPYGEESKKKEIASAQIWNTLMKDEQGRHLYGYNSRTDGKVTEHGDIMHKRSDGIWVLLNRAIEDMMAGGNSDKTP